MIPKKSQKNDYRSPLDVRWCSGCGDYYILNALTSAWSNIGLGKENIALVSGIGCSSRLPYYCSTYGFHTIHGRAPTVALGLKVTRPELSVWVITGDGDGLSIGAHHLVHLCRRNPDINVLLFNNEIYGLTKGQASPTSQQGLTTRSTPQGSLEPALQALPLAISSGATFVARIVDTDLAMMRDVFERAHAHRGLSFIEIYTNCVIYNDGAFSSLEKRSQRNEHAVILREGEPLVFGRQKDRALIWQDFAPQVVSLSDVPSSQTLPLHNPSHRSPLYAYALSQPPSSSAPHAGAHTGTDISSQTIMTPMALGILRQVTQPTFEEQIREQTQALLVPNTTTDSSSHSSAASPAHTSSLESLLNRSSFTRPSKATFSSPSSSHRP